MSSFSNLPIELINYIIYNFLDFNDVKSLLVTSKIFNVLSLDQFENLKNKWLLKYTEIIKENIKVDNNWIGTGGVYEYKKIFGKKEGLFVKQINYIYGCVSKYKNISGNYRNDKLHGKYEINYRYYLSRCYSCGNKNVGTQHEFNGFLNFEDGKLLDFVILNNDLELTNNGIIKLQKKVDEEPNSEINEVARQLNNIFGDTISQETIETNDIISLLELDDEYKIQLCQKLNINSIENVQFID